MGRGVKKVVRLVEGGVKSFVTCEGGQKVWRRKFLIVQPPPPKYFWTLPKGNGGHSLKNEVRLIMCGPEDPRPPGSSQDPHHLALKQSWDLFFFNIVTYPLW